MSLDNIQLPSIVLQDLYKKSLNEFEVKQTSASVATAKEISSLGKNNKRITILVADKEALYLPDEQLNFLLGILSACKLTMEDVSIVNVEKNKGLTYKSIVDELKAEKVFLFGIETSVIDLPIAFPVYQLQSYNNQVYLAAASLINLQNDKAEKMNLWNCLKKVFSI
ncbi:hypothetical protein [Ferruginibacter albus]|uniref:hypothetical protein n=1 Tax=Ferruginibacter albus TaxID=2875540 RepID=UPI001CC42C24|nr:hypothetical protein [Ferruginibacter albus]UAY52592.1 hypothetical protein K9M53_02615 [Ferruginibacter albus]